MARLQKATVVVYNHGKYQYGTILSKATKRQRVVYEVRLDNGNLLLDVPVDNLQGNLYINSKLSKMDIQ